MYLNNTRPSRPRTPIFKMDRLMPAHHPSWATSYVLVAYRNESLRPLHIHSPRLHNNSPNHPHPNPNMAVASIRRRITIHMHKIPSSHKASTRISPLPLVDRQLHLKTLCPHRTCNRIPCSKARCMLNKANLRHNKCNSNE